MGSNVQLVVGDSVMIHGPVPKRGKERKLWALRPQKPLRLIRDGEVGGQELYI